ncbi:MAG TPA: preprotein translocase subunit YajC [Corynebacterium sp.]|nr:preprotein translocase subunit YajC [Corynebacterium sp.]
MEFLILLIILAVFLLPTLLMTRKQNQRQKEMIQMQDSLQPGNRVVTGAGLHGTVHQVRDTEIDLEVAPGTVVTVEKMAILRHVEPPAPGLDPTQSAAGEQPGASAAGESQPEPGDTPHPEDLR